MYGYVAASVAAMTELRLSQHGGKPAACTLRSAKNVRVITPFRSAVKHFCQDFARPYVQPRPIRLYLSAYLCGVECVGTYEDGS